MIHALKVSKWFGTSSRSGLSGGAGRVLAVRDLSLQIPEGQVVGLLGPNGAGKTTTIRMLTGFIPPSMGRLSIGGHDTIDDSTAARRLIGYLPEAAPLYPEMRVVEFLLFRAGLYGMRRPDARRAAQQAMERCWLTDMRRRRISALSKGYRQRVGLAAALLHDPPVLVLDEPSNGLDPTQIRETRGLIRELSHKRTVLVSSHILPEIEKTCDRVVIIARGQLRADGSPSELVNRFEAGGTAYGVEFLAKSAADVELGRKTLQGVPGVAGVEVCALSPTTDPSHRPMANGQWPSWYSARLRARYDQHLTDLREPIARAMHTAGLLVRDLQRLQPSLEQIYFRVIEEAESGAQTDLAQRAIA